MFYLKGHSKQKTVNTVLKTEIASCSFLWTL